MVARNADLARAPASAASLAATSSVMSVKDCTMPPEGRGSIRTSITLPLGRRLTYDFGKVPVPVRKYCLISSGNNSPFGPNSPFFHAAIFHSSLIEDQQLAVSIDECNSLIHMAQSYFE